MRQIWTIAKKELNTFFDSLIAYILLVAFLGVCGFLTWIWGQDVFMVKEASLSNFFGVAYVILFLFIPALTMRLLAEENNQGTLELLLTRAVNDWQILIGKFLGCFVLVLIALALTLPYYFTVWSLGPIDHGAVWCGYLGLILVSAAFISIGLFTSSTTSNQIVAFLMAFFIGLLIVFIFPFLGSGIPGTVGELLTYLSINSHFDSMSRGVIDSKDVIYFLSIMLLGLVLSEIVLSKRNLVD